MKDDLQKWLDLDLEMIQEKPLTDIQKQKIKHTVLGKPKRKKRRMKTWMTVAAASVMIVTTSYFTLPSIASQLPFIENIVSFVDQDFVPGNYEELSTVIGDSQSSNGIDMMIESAVYDGTNIMITFALDTTYDLGDYPMLGSRPLLQNKTADGMSSVSSLEKIDETTYIGVEKITPHFKQDAPAELLIQWVPESVTNGATGKTFEGDWSFEFKVPKLETKTKTLVESSQHPDGQLSFTNLTSSDLTAVLHYEFQIVSSVLTEWPLSIIEVTEAVDNFGHSHRVHGSSGSVTEDGHGTDWKLSLYTLSEDITSLTFTPVIHYVKDSGMSPKRETMEPITIQLKEEPAK